MISAVNLPQTLRAPAMTAKRLRHFPFRRRIEKRYFFTRFNVAETRQLHRRCVKQGVRVATVVDVFEMVGRKRNVFIIIDLHRQIRWCVGDIGG